MSEDGEAQPSGAPPGPSATSFEVVIEADGSVTVDGEPVPVIGDQPLDTAILDTLHGYAQVRAAPVTAAISNPATGYAVSVEVNPDGSSGLVGQDAGPAAGTAPGPAGPGVGPPDPASPDAAGPGRTEGTAAENAGPAGPAPAATDGDMAKAAGAGERIASPSGPRPSRPRPSVPARPRPSLAQRPSLAKRSSSSATGGTGPHRSRGSDEEYERSSLLKNPWLIASTAVAVAALIMTPIALAGSSDGEQSTGATRKRLEISKDHDGRGPSGTVRPSRPAQPSGSPFPKPSKKDKKSGKPKSPSPDTGRASGEGEPRGTGLSAGGKNTTGSAATIPSGTTMVVNRGTGKCVDLPGTGEGKLDGPVQQGACDTSAGSLGGNQRWHLDLKNKGAGPGGADLYLIRNVKDNLCLDLPDFGPVKSTTPVTEYHCRAEKDNQLWWFDKQAGGTFWIRNDKSGHLCLDVADRKKANSPLRIVGCEDDDARQWRFRKP